MGCEVGSLLGSSLGLPLCLDPPKSFWSSLIDKIHTKLVGWKGALLSHVGKIIVLKSTAQNIPLYALNFFKIPRKYVVAIERI